ncbi:MAG: hypothetical protein HY791_29735 [Deltaproteobacteria bacterium]|nr:hypothetical protein [Deltaproteobacteria bacterium]
MDSNLLPIENPRPLGGGKYADVFEGTAKRGAHRGKTVVLKVARSELRSTEGVTGGVYFAQGLFFATGSVSTWDPDPNEVIRTEGDILAKIRHPAFVRLLDRGESFGRQYLLLERVAGRTWREVIYDDPRSLFESLVELVRALADVAASGELRFHGDLKPENLLLDDSKRTRILDPSSGMARLGPGGVPSQLVLTDWYNPALELSDLPSLGLLIAEVYTRRQLVLAASDDRPAKTLGPRLGDWIRLREITGGAKLMRRLPHLPLPSELEPSVPKGIDEIVLKCLGLGFKKGLLDAIDPYSGPAELVMALERR